MSYLGHRTLNESDWLPVPELSWKRRSRTRDEKKCCVSISECMWRMHDRNGDGFLSELVKFEGIEGATVHITEKKSAPLCSTK